MRLKSLTFEDKRTGWTLEDLRLDPFNLLVGASGVGKTRILRAIQAISRISQGIKHPRMDRGVRFDAHFEQDGQDYQWQFDSLSAPPDEDGNTTQAAESVDSILSERLYTSTEGRALVERDSDRFLFNGKELPILSRAASALLLFDEPTIVRVRHAFTNSILDTLTSEAPSPRLRARDVRAWIATVFPTLESLQDTPATHTLIKAFALQERFPGKFDEFKQHFIDIFPTVEDVVVGLSQTVDTKSGISHDTLLFRIKERHVSSWIDAADISSGMNRTMHHIVDLMLASKGTLVLIDEFENSLGVNCMGPLTDLIRSRAHELQFIITSHHPYIINNIPKENWKIVRRKGSTVQVTPASKVAALQGASAQDDFIRLLNSSEFEEGLG